MFINIGKSYIRAEDIKRINAVEAGTEEDKKFGITVITESGNYKLMCEGRTARNELLQRILDQTNGPGAEIIEIRKQLANLNTRVNQIDRKLGEIRKVLKSKEAEE